MVLWWMIRPRRDGNTRSSDAGSVRAASSTARAAVESGTRCGLRIFRPLGLAPSTVASSMSISVHRTPRVSLERGRCQDGESDGEGGRGVQGFKGSEGGGCFMGRCGGEVPGWWFPPGQDAVEDFARGIGL